MARFASRITGWEKVRALAGRLACRGTPARQLRGSGRVCGKYCAWHDCGKVTVSATGIRRLYENNSTFAHFSSAADFVSFAFAGTGCQAHRAYAARTHKCYGLGGQFPRNARPCNEGRRDNHESGFPKISSLWCRLRLFWTLYRSTEQTACSQEAAIWLRLSTNRKARDSGSGWTNQNVAYRKPDDLGKKRGLY